MRTCIVCHSELIDEDNVCKKCGMPIIYIPGNGKDNNNELQKYADEYINQLLQKTRLGVYGECYSADADGYINVGREYVDLFDLSQIRVGETYWADYKFAQGTPNAEFTLMLVRQQNDTTGEFEVKCSGPELKDFWYLGIKINPGFSLQLLIGNKDKYSVSEEFSLFE